ncbi:MAG: hypothetical protein HY341_00325 [Candidatus Kerfeldbacteria bacterium]|nr:hypothetical protein [Candidatus Kerfeldbacteria bacterium]
MRRPWFTPFHWIALPASWEGWLVALMTTLVCVQIFIGIDQRSHSVSDTLYNAFPYIVPMIGIYLWIASKTSHSS